MHRELRQILEEMRKSERECVEKAALYYEYIAHNPCSDIADEPFIQYQSRCSELRFWIERIERVVG